MAPAVQGRYMLLVSLGLVSATTGAWCFTGVYGPQDDDGKVQFLDELLQFGRSLSLPWLIGGDFNMIHRAQDKNNDRLDRRSMRRFRAFIDRAQLDELVLQGHRFTWSNGQGRPTLELLDRFFATDGWMTAFPQHVLKPLLSDCSNHCPCFSSCKHLGRLSGGSDLRCFGSSARGLRR